ncbi:SRPBCC family protein [Yoonia sp. R2331]|uniref:SRPBCC family protein n=1 Tax=Yoonia sp. R2331 TaxID=3237238 RepID=UPI0034E533D8
MPHFQTSRLITAPVDRVWAILTNRSLLANGDFGITRLDGPAATIATGQRIALYSEVAGNRAFKLRVVQADGRRMIWRGGMPLGLFTGTRQFDLTPEADGTRFDMAETFTGPMSGLILKSMPDLTPSFETFAAALARHATKEIA